MVVIVDNRDPHADAVTRSTFVLAQLEFTVQQTILPVVSVLLVRRSKVVSDA